MGKKKRREPEEAKPSFFDRVFANRALTIALGALIIVAFAGLAVLTVTLLGGDELSEDEPNSAIPAPIGPPPEIARSAAADVLADKTWDEMTEDERALVEREVKRVFDDGSFRATNGFVTAVDVFRQDGETLVSRTYPAIEAAGGQETGQQTVFYCTTDDRTIEGYRYFISSVKRDFYKGRIGEFPPAWSPVMSGTDWSNVIDLGKQEVNGQELHGLELGFALPSGTNAGVKRRVQYWFDVETARLIERGEVLETAGDTEANWYRLRYDQLQPPDVPSDLEQPACVQEILAAIAP